MRRIKIGIIGAGFVGPIHIESVRRLGFVDVVAIAEITQQKANEVAEKFGISKAYGDWKDLVSDSEIEVVHVTCSNELHYQISKACIQAGKNVVCEKPLTLNMNEAKELVELAKERNVVNATTFNMGFYPLVKEAKELIARGELGKIFLVVGRCSQDWLSKDTDYNWRVESKYQGKSRVISDLGSHWIQMVQMILDRRIMSVYGDKTIFIPVRKKPTIEIPTFSEQELKPGEYEELIVDTEDHATILMKFEGGAKGVFIASQVCPGRKNILEWEINGSEKSIAWQQEDPNQLWIGNRSKPNEILMRDPSLLSDKVRQYAPSPGGLAEGYVDSWKNILGKLYDYIRKEGHLKDLKPEYPTFEEGYRNMIVIDSVLQSIEKDKWIDIDWEDF